MRTVNNLFCHRVSRVITILLCTHVWHNVIMSVIMSCHMDSGYLEGSHNRPLQSPSDLEMELGVSVAVLPPTFGNSIVK